MQKSLIAALAALPFLAFTPQAAYAGGVDVDIGVGVPGPGYYDYDDDYDYRPRRYYRERWDRPHRYGRLSCGEARRLVRRSGYRNVVARDCSGRTYAFRATRYGERVRVYVNSRNGAVWGG